MANVLDLLRERGFIKQITFEEDLYRLLDEEQVTFYVGFDPTADSLHIGHYIPIMAMAHMQRAGHRPIAVMGGGTAVIGDPSGRSDMRTMLTNESIAQNVSAIQAQMSRFLDFSDGKALLVNNADWLLPLNYVEFIRDIGVHFSVNRMLSAECYKNRMEKGLTFLEFNYMLMQAYDFLMLNQQYGCTLQMGGDDQWSNMLAGADLIRRKEHKPAYACTFSLLLNSEGNKMGKTAKGALWLSADKTSPYEFYQYWRNVEDAVVKNCLALLTFLPMDEVNRLGNLPGERINEAKKALAYEVTRLIHGDEEAEKAAQAAEALFGGGGDLDNMPTSEFTAAQLTGLRLAELAQQCRLTKSIGEGRRLIGDGGLSVDGEKVIEIDATVPEEAIVAGSFMLRKGKKTYHRVLVR
ncbi:MAG: tyrosine--tRNA ligase [Eubacteriales bacterium]|nr:tyrosine--tRNA ligase [Eubacteriales bacterium]